MKERGPKASYASLDPGVGRRYSFGPMRKFEFLRAAAFSTALAFSPAVARAEESPSQGVSLSGALEDTCVASGRNVSETPGREGVSVNALRLHAAIEAYLLSMLRRNVDRDSFEPAADMIMHATEHCTGDDYDAALRALFAGNPDSRTATSFQTTITRLRNRDAGGLLQIPRELLPHEPTT